ncbi:hypothetical protein C1637_24760 [Chryseobacterium lactis]|uniref:Type VI secretion system (T6SS), amidase effector protein 4 n=1 Tax=Chryseobacterium lactis TaxID=1241981 RepID=A0A3G6RUH7_CHRLC|nr:T6SS effector amidase Tae4 family protein [Chryseobacterium lactis]AZA81941.1 hypothetical protein EG342_08480 [Chryseobacterium lactis]AZB06939.1 hypothetical protein EG341_24595 [Chryseobacterium lactis]PNW10989.1 hypothetical protein C1637_24760 [Chryseobacterium lactis]
MNIEKLIPILLEQQRKFVAQSGSQKTKAVQVKRPSWADMIKNYPNTSKKTVPLYNEIGNGLIDLFNKAPDDWENTCSFRMSKGLNYSGFKLPYNNTKYKAKGAKGGVHIGKDKLNYWYRVKELGKYLEEHLGTPEFDEKLEKVGVGKTKTGLPKDKWDRLHKIKGIIMFKVSGWGNASGHFTLWDGKNLIYPGESVHDDPNSEYYYFHMKYEQNGKVIQTDEIKLWELK